MADLRIPDEYGFVTAGLRHRAAVKAPVRPMRIAAAKPAPPTKVSAPIIAPKAVPRSLWGLIGLVAQDAGVTILDIRGNSRRVEIVHARSVIANLAVLMLGWSFAGLDRELNRGDGLAWYYCQRHKDRLVLYPAYRALYERCAAAFKQVLP